MSDLGLAHQAQDRSGRSLTPPVLPPMVIRGICLRDPAWHYRPSPTNTNPAQ